MVFNLIFGFANSFATFLVFMFFNGLVQAGGWPGSVGSVSEWLRPAERGRIMGVWSTNYLFGNMIIKSLGGYLLGRGGMALVVLGLHPADLRGLVAPLLLAAQPAPGRAPRTDH